MARLTSPTGAAVSVDDGKVDELLRRGFTAEQEKRAPAKKAAAKKTAAPSADKS
jgi:hypothetical protein